MSSCKTHKLPKRKPYGARRGIYWCWGCDSELVPDHYGTNPKPIKKAERRKAREEITKELKLIGK